MILNFFALFTGIISLLLLAYLAMLAFASLLPDSREKKRDMLHRFCILIPAHNEEKAIADTIKAVRHVDYYEKLYDIVVISDNSSDDTAGTAQKAHVKVLERKEGRAEGKGTVLRWAFERLPSLCSHDAFVVIDADTWMDDKFLKIMNDSLCKGEKAVQAYSQVRHPERSITESISFLGFALNRNLRYRGRSRLGWSANLMGTGMCFSREIIEKFGWPTTTLVEDVEFTMFLRTNGIRVCFEERAGVTVELHGNLHKTKDQRLRWDMGKMELRNRYVPLLLKRAFTKRDIACLDSVLELLIPPFPIFFLIITGCSALFISIFQFYPQCLTGCTLWIINGAGMLSYTMAGIISARARPAVYKALVHAPFLVLWRALIVAKELLKKNRVSKW